MLRLNALDYRLARDKLFSRDSVFVLIVLLLTVILFVIPSPFESPYKQNVQRYRAEVLAVDNSMVQQFGIVQTGDQQLTVRLIDGPFAGRETEAVNSLLGKMDIDKMYRVGDTAYVVPDVEGDQIVSARAFDHYRLNVELLLFGLFVALLVIFAGWTGVRALMSFIFAVLLIWKVLLPLVLAGLDPVLIALVVVAALSAVTMGLVAGFNRTALVAFLGSLLGILLTFVLASLLFPAFRLHGAILAFSETLLYSGFAHLDLTRLFLAAVFLGASGAVMDLAIDVAASMGEVIQKRPDLARRELVESGFAVGRAMTSTMVTTLLMAYTAGYMALLMIFLSQGIPAVNIVNMNFVAGEVLKTLVGSFGLVTVAPFTAIVGGLIFVRGGAHG
jgi:uncharacterized membrane protein